MAFENTSRMVAGLPEQTRLARIQADQMGNAARNMKLQNMERFMEGLMGGWERRQARSAEQDRWNEGATGRAADVDFKRAQTEGIRGQEERSQGMFEPALRLALSEAGITEAQSNMIVKNLTADLEQTIAGTDSIRANTENVLATTKQGAELHEGAMDFQEAQVEGVKAATQATIGGEGRAASRHKDELGVLQANRKQLEHAVKIAPYMSKASLELTYKQIAGIDADIEHKKDSIALQTLSENNNKAYRDEVIRVDREKIKAAREAGEFTVRSELSEQRGRYTEKLLAIARGAKAAAEGNPTDDFKALFGTKAISPEYKKDLLKTAELATEAIRKMEEENDPAQFFVNAFLELPIYVDGNAISDVNEGY